MYGRRQIGQNTLIETVHSLASSNKRINPAKYGTSHNQLLSALNFKQHYITVHKLFFSGKAGSRKSCILSLSLSLSLSIICKEKATSLISANKLSEEHHTCCPQVIVH